jgi:hypothetical protein
VAGWWRKVTAHFKEIRQGSTGFFCKKYTLIAPSDHEKRTNRRKMQKRADLARPCGYQQILLKDLWTMQPERRQAVDVTTDSPSARFRIRASRLIMACMRRALHRGAPSEA